MAQPTGLDRLKAAERAARDRLTSVLATGDVEAAFPPLGETLAWLYAAADTTGYKSPKVSALKYARNVVLHGQGILIAQSHFQWGAEPGMFVPGASMLGSASGFVWSFATLPNPNNSWTGQWRH